MPPQPRPCTHATGVLLSLSTTAPCSLRQPQPHGYSAAVPYTPGTRHSAVVAPWHMDTALQCPSLLGAQLSLTGQPPIALMEEEGAGCQRLATYSWSGLACGCLCCFSHMSPIWKGHRKEIPSTSYDLHHMCPLLRQSKAPISPQARACTRHGMPAPLITSIACLSQGRLSSPKGGCLEKGALRPAYTECTACHQSLQAWASWPRMTREWGTIFSHPLTTLAARNH